MQYKILKRHRGAALKIRTEGNATLTRRGGSHLPRLEILILLFSFGLNLTWTWSELEPLVLGEVFVGDL